MTCLWQNLLRWFLGTRYNPPKKVFGHWLPDEPFIELYGELSCGGCKDYIVEYYQDTTDGIKYYNIDDLNTSQMISGLKFIQTEYNPSYAHFWPLTLGTINVGRNENICQGAKFI